MSPIATTVVASVATVGVPRALTKAARVGSRSRAMAKQIRADHEDRSGAQRNDRQNGDEPGPAAEDACAARAGSAERASAETGSTSAARH
jgi:hypothetical protein